jgi:threonine synthase
MKFCSTRDAGLSVPLAQALFSPRAPDGGVFMPREDVDLRNYFYMMDESMSFEDVVRAISAEVLKGEARAGIVEGLAEAAALLHPRLLTLDEEVTLLELYNGPTAAFQDFSISFLAVLMEKLRPEGRRIKILIPTAGDSGRAAAHAFAGKEGFDIVLLCPASGLRGIPRELRLAAGGNTRVIAVDADRSAVQSLASGILASEEAVKALSLATATTLNPGRFLTQTFHYIYGFIQLKKQAGDMYFDIPSGNHGNFTSGILAWRWGMPVTGFIGASWRESPVADPRGGKSAAGERLAREKAGAPAFADVVNPDHYERMTYLSSGNPGVLRSIIYSSIVSQEKAIEAAKTAYRRYGIFMAPPTAVGYAAALEARDDFLEETGKIILLGTSHPAKFADEIEKNLGVRPPGGTDGPSLESSPDETIPPTIDALREALSF